MRLCGDLCYNRICMRDGCKKEVVFALKKSRRQREAVFRMDVRVGDILVMKKNHPCGENKFLVLRSGMDFKLRCTRCGREVMIARSKAEKNIRQIQRPQAAQDGARQE